MSKEFSKWLEEILSECTTFNIDESFHVRVGNKYDYTFTYREVLEKIEESSEEQTSLINEVYERSPELSVDDVLRGYLEYVSVK